MTPPHIPQGGLSGKTCQLSSSWFFWPSRESVEEEEDEEEEEEEKKKKDGVRADPVRVQVTNQQLECWCERHRDLLFLMTAAAAASSAAAVPHRSPGDAMLLDALRDRNAAAGMFVNETARGWFRRGIMMQPCRSQNCCSPAHPEEEERGSGEGVDRREGGGLFGGVGGSFSLIGHL